MNYLNLHSRLEADPDFAASIGLSNAFPAITALSMLSGMFGVPLAALTFSPVELSLRLPKLEVPEAGQRFFGADLQRYQSWRRLILDALLVFTQRPVDADELDGLRRVARLTLGPIDADKLYSVAKHLPDGLRLGDLSRQDAIKIDDLLVEEDRPGFRAGLGALDRLRQVNLITEAGMMERERIGHLPQPTRHDTNAPLPPRLRAYFEGASKLVRTALPFVWRLATQAGVLNRMDDVAPSILVSPDVLSKLIWLDPQDFGFAKPNGATYKVYLKRLAAALDPDAFDRIHTEREAPEKDWKELRLCLRKAGWPGRADRLTPVATRAIEDRLSPSQLGPEWFESQQIGLEGKYLSAFRSAALLVDDLRDADFIRATLLPVLPTGVRRLRSRGGKPGPTTNAGQKTRELEPTPEVAWSNFFADLRVQRVEKERLHPLYALKKHSVSRGLAPCQLTVSAICDMREGVSTAVSAKLSLAAKTIDELMAVSELSDHLPSELVGRLPDRRLSAPELDASISEELECALKRRGLGASAARGVRIAVKALADQVREDGREGSSLRDLMALDFDRVEWGPREELAGRYLRSLRGLRYFLFLPWTMEWTALQDAVVDAGICANENPVPVLLRYAEERSPTQLDLEWAQTIDKRLRKPTKSSKHGRADLALTFAKNVARLDELHRVERLGESGLLPDLIGRIRE